MEATIQQIREDRTASEERINQRFDRMEQRIDSLDQKFDGTRRYITSLCVTAIAAMAGIAIAVAGIAATIFLTLR